MNRVVAITGAGSGVGRATALVFARSGAALELSDRDAAGLAETRRMLDGAGMTVTSRLVDVSDAAAVRAYAEEVLGRHSGVDVLVNNAGVAFVGEVTRTAPEHWDQIFRVNVLGVVHAVQAFAPALRARRGQIVNVASASVFWVPRTLGAYAASKRALTGLSDALRAEVAADGVAVTVVCPGLVATPLAEHLGLPEGDERERERLRELLSRRGCPPERVAQAIYDACERRPALVTVGTDAALLRFFEHWLPGLLPKLVSRVGSRRTVRDTE